MKILIVCTGNTCRSPMAEGIFTSLIKENNLDIEISSAGTYAFDGDSVTNHAEKALKKIGIDISNHKSTLAHSYLIEKVDLILTMTTSHKETIIRKFPESKDKVFSLYEYAFAEFKDVADPFGGTLMDYENARDDIYKAVEEIVRKLKERNLLW